MFGLPTALIGSAFGAITGFLTKAFAMRQEVVAAERKHQIDAMVAVTAANQGTVEQEIALLAAKADFEERAAATDPHRSEARRYIAYSMVASMAFLIPALVVFGEVTWFDFYTYDYNGFFGIGAREIVETVSGVGMPLAWLEGMLGMVGAVISFYLGGSSAKFVNPYTKR